ncbi:MAG: Appr-1-p processing protein [Arthrospira sp. PLM2.Bin9]|nr:macro domain-containing protein [Arthrospira sp. PLM2.Bin9]TVU53410.1 MAG: Appr-1-p processing protein [Arthrospira sp. PLM2.Bin9]
MIKYTDTTVFNVESQTIVNTVNCVGVMGAGLALEFKLRYPDMYEDYINRCQQKQVQVDRPYLYRGYGSPWIMNFATKNNWKYPSKIEWIEQGLAYFVNNYERAKIKSIAFPKLGCDRGGLNWNDVQKVMEKYLTDVDIDVYICLDRESHASGIEGLMVEMLNNQNNQFWISQLKIRSNIADKINSSLPIPRFRQLQKIPGVGKKTYEDIFKLLYSKSQSESQSEMTKNLPSDRPSPDGDSETEPTQLQFPF